MAGTAVFSEWFGKQIEGKMSAGEFAQKAGISRAAAYFYKSGDRVPDRTALAKIARALGLNLADLPEFAPKAKA